MVSFGKIKSESTEKYISQFKKQGKNYHIISIIGGQSSGKTTLINHLFDLNLKVMNSKEERKQTTEGIWMQFVSQNKILIMDIEGSDSRERWDKNTQFSNKTALFGLVMSNALIVNVCTKNIGRYTACNYEILSTAFELNLRYFNKESKKKIIFALRDFSEEENLDYIKQILEKDLKEIWRKIQKPKEAEFLEYFDVFDMKIFTFSHYSYQKQNFLQDIKSLKEALINPDKRDYIFSSYYTENVPLDGFICYARKIWNIIRENKDLNIPNEKTMISYYRCNEVKEEALKKSSNHLEIMKRKSRSATLHNEYQILKQTSLNYYRENTIYYDKNIAQKIEVEMIFQIEFDFDEIFRNSNEQFISDIMKIISKNINESLSNPTISVLEILIFIENIKQEKSKQYQDFLTSYFFEEWKKNDFMNYFISRIENEINGYLVSTVNILTKKLVEDQLSEAKTMVFQFFENISIYNWQILDQQINQKIGNLDQEIFQFKSKFKEFNSVFNSHFIFSLKNDFVQGVKKMILENKKQIGKILKTYYKNLFFYDKKGVPRNWKQYTEDQIQLLFQQIIENSQQINEFLNSHIYLKSLQEEIISKEEAIDLQNQLKQTLKSLLDEALEQKYKINSYQKIPFWFWIILILLISDKIFSWILNPSISFLILAILIFFYFYQKKKFSFYFIIKCILRTISFLRNLFKSENNDQRNISLNDSLNRSHISINKKRISGEFYNQLINYIIVKSSLKCKKIVGMQTSSSGISRYSISSKFSSISFSNKFKFIFKTLPLISFHIQLLA